MSLNSIFTYISDLQWGRARFWCAGPCFKWVLGGDVWGATRGSRQSHQQQPELSPRHLLEMGCGLIQK